jgi:hypothetical protein
MLTRRASIRITAVALLMAALCRCSAPAGDSRSAAKKVGIWYLLLWFDDPSAGYFPWEQYVRLTPLEPRYDSADPAHIRATLLALSELGVDFVILDDTNGYYRHDGRFIASVDTFFRELVAFNESHGTAIEAALAIGYEWYAAGDTELQQRALDYAYEVSAHPNYFRLDGKPLLVIYVDPSNSVRPDDRFAVRLASGSDKWIASPTGVWGWKFEYPQAVYSEAMGVMPGWDRNHNTLTGSTPTPRDGGRYYEESWDFLIAANPRIAVITSWDDWGEETAIAPALDWVDRLGQANPYLYVNMTRDKIRRFKGTPRN